MQTTYINYLLMLHLKYNQVIFAAKALIKTKVTEDSLVKCDQIQTFYPHRQTALALHNQ